MFLFSSNKKETARDIAVKRLNSLVTNRRESCSSLSFQPSSEEEIGSMVEYIKDYATRTMSVNKESVRVHISKDGDTVTIVTNIVYNK